MKQIYISLFFIFLLFGCIPKPPTLEELAYPDRIGAKLIWSSQVKEMLFIDHFPYDDTKIVVGFSETSLAALNIADGAKIWETSVDRFTASVAPIIYNNILLFQYSRWEKFYAINMNNGRKIIEHTFPKIGDGQTLVAYNKVLDKDDYTVFVSTFNDLTTRKRIDIPYLDSIDNSLTNSFFFLSIEGVDTFLLFNYFYELGYKKVQKVMYKYDIQNDKIVYAKKNSFSDDYSNLVGISQGIAIDMIDKSDISKEGKYINSRLIMQAIDAKTGDEIYSTVLPFGMNVGVAATTVGENYIVSNEIDSMYCFDLQTGKQLWAIYGPGNATERGAILNGIIYFASGTRLWAVELSSGKVLWRQEAFDGTRTMMGLAVIPGKSGKKGKVITRSVKHAYCFEAIR